MKKYIIIRIENKGEPGIRQHLFAPCTVSVPSDGAIKSLEHGNSYDGPLWEEQAEFEPKIGYTALFTSTSMDDGWLRVSKIQSYEKQEDGIIIFKTLNSVYKLEEYKDKQ